jgi:hypothetical protein
MVTVDDNGQKDRLVVQKMLCQLSEELEAFVIKAMKYTNIASWPIKFRRLQRQNPMGSHLKSIVSKDNIVL